MVVHRCVSTVIAIHAVYAFGFECPHTVVVVEKFVLLIASRIRIDPEWRRNLRPLTARATCACLPISSILILINLDNAFAYIGFVAKIIDLAIKRPRYEYRTPCAC